MKILISVFVVAILSSCGSRRELASYEVVNFLLTQDSITNRVNLLDELQIPRVFPEEGLGLEGFDTGITPDDEAYIFKQAKDSSSFRLDASKLIVRPTLVPAKEIHDMLKRQDLESFWKKVREKYVGGYYSITKPLFSKDMKKAIVSVGYHCGSLCGSGHTYVYGKKMVYGKS